MAEPINPKRVGELIKTLRKSKGLTGEDLGKKANISQSKISKIETGFYKVVQRGEVTHLLNILDAPKHIRQQVDLVLDRMGPTTGPYQGIKVITDALQWEAKSQDIKIFVINSIPALLQTMELRTEALKKFYGSLGDGVITKLLKDTLRRQDLLWDKKRKYHIIMHQAGLYYVRDSKIVHLSQLDRLERMIGLENLKFGIIPVEAGLPVAENGSFALYDNSFLTKATATGDIGSKDEHEINLHIKIFEELDQLAFYGDEAKLLIRKAIDYIE